MRAGNRQRALPHPKGGEHLGAVPDGDVAAFGFFELGVVLQDSGGNNHHIGVQAIEVFGLLADEDLNARFAQLLGITAFAQVGAGNFHALILGNMGNAAHADATDTDEMNFFDAILHRG